MSESVLLAFDSATPLLSAAVLRDGVVVAEQASTAPMKHGEQLMPLISDVMAAAGISPGELTGIAVGVGPGPFTGLRVGVVTARTLGFTLGVDVLGICTLDALAAQASAEGVTGRFLVATDARRKEVYHASYETIDGRIRRLDGPSVSKPAVVATDLPVVGEGAALYPDDFPHAAGPTRPSAGWLARLAAEGVGVLASEPLYLRRPDAVAQQNAKAVS